MIPSHRAHALIALMLSFSGCATPAPATDSGPRDTSPADGGPDCSAGPAVGCPCDPPGMVLCMTADHPQLYCGGISPGVWAQSADACGERDAGPRDASAGDAFTPADAVVEPDAAANDAGSMAGSGTFGGSCATDADCASGVC